MKIALLALLSTLSVNATANTLTCDTASIFDNTGQRFIQKVNLNNKTIVDEKVLSITMTDAKGNSVVYLKDYNVWRPLDGDDTLIHNPGSNVFKLYTIHFNQPVLIDFHCI